MAYSIGDFGGDPRETLEKIVKRCNWIPFLKVRDTYKELLRFEGDIKKYGLAEASKISFHKAGVNLEIVGSENIPSGHGNLYVANHIYGMLDGLAVLGEFSQLVESKGKKVKVVVNKFLRSIKGIEERAIFVDLNGNTKMTELRGLKHALDDGNLFLFPSATLSGHDLEEPSWNGHLGLVRCVENVVPMWFNGPNHGFVYNFLSKYNATKNLRYFLALREGWNKKGETITLNIGSPISSEELVRFNGNSTEITSYIRQRAEELKYIQSQYSKDKLTPNSNAIS